MLGQFVWLPHKTLIWCPVQIISREGEVTRYSFPDGSTLDLSDHQLDPHKLDPVSATALNVQLNNLINLDEIHEGAVIHLLRERYNANSIYTAVGSILISINPYQQLPLYSSAIIQAYRNRTAENSLTLAPHVFGVSAEAYERIQDERINQAILISGESGAGKE